MKTRLRVIAATLVGAMMLMTLPGCSKTEDRSPAMAETATPTAIPTTGGADHGSVIPRIQSL